MSLRCFIAVELEDAITKELAGLQERLRRDLEVDRKAVKWVRPENIHLTLKFLGQVEDPMVADICTAVSQTAQEYQPFDFEVGNCGCFPAAGSARVVWVGITKGLEQLEPLQQHLDRRLQSLGFAPEGRRFNPHLTLGRVKQFKAGLQVQESVKAIKPFVLGFQDVSSLTVFESRLAREGPEYTALHHGPLGQ